MGEIFAYVIVVLFVCHVVVVVCVFAFFFNPTIEVVTFRLRGWCMLGVFLLLAFARLGHEHQDHLSPCDGMHVYADKISIYTSSKRLWGEWSQNPC